MNKLSLFNWVKSYIAKHYSGEAGKMLVHTGAIGWTLSSLAQIIAIIINDKIPKEQKMFLVPQEAADAAVNIFSFYVITSSCNKLAKLLVNTGKWLPENIRKFLIDNNLTDKIGKISFDVAKDSNLTPELASAFGNFRNIVDVGVTTAGSILSCNIVTPLLRNQFAAARQKKSVEKLYEVKKNSADAANYLPRPTMSDFQSRLNRGYLKI